MKTKKLILTSVEATEAIEPQGPLSATEKNELATCEQQVASNTATAASSTAQAALALKTIRDKKLYRADFPTWEAYVKERWSYSKSYSHQLIAFAEIYEIVKAATKSATGRPLLPTSERQVRPLAKLDGDEKILDAWREAVARSNGKAPAGALVKAIVGKMIPAQSKVHQPNTSVTQSLETIEVIGAGEVERREDTPDADDVASMNVSDVSQQDADGCAQDDETGDASIPDVAPATEPRYDDHASLPMQGQDTQGDQDRVGGTAEGCEWEAEASGEVEETATTRDEPAHQQEPINTPPRLKALGQASRAEELAEACRMAVAGDVDANVATAIYNAVRMIVEQSLLLMAA